VRRYQGADIWDLQKDEEQTAELLKAKRFPLSCSDACKPCLPAHTSEFDALELHQRIACIITQSQLVQCWAFWTQCCQGFMQVDAGFSMKLT